MKMPLRFSLYISKQFLISTLIVFCAFSVIVFLVDMMELLRRAQSREVPLYIVLQMALLRMPLMIQKMGPFVILVGAILSLSRLTRNNELIIARASGISAWQFLMPVVLSALGIGIFMVTILNPLGCTMLSRYEFLEGKYLHGRTSMLAVSSSGLWLKQKRYEEESDTPSGEIILHAARAGQDEVELFD
ncbi:MAG: LptF/LptG family permease, partial [Rickettsiales bacterium]|nr:LptF/LptG family permease [Rickettsiales bacterium]